MMEYWVIYETTKGLPYKCVESFDVRQPDEYRKRLHELTVARSVGEIEILYIIFGNEIEIPEGVTE